MLNPQFYDRIWPIRLKQLSEKDTKGHSRGSNNQHSILSFEGFQNLRQILFKSLGVTLKERTRTNMVKTRSSMFGVPPLPLTTLRFYLCAALTLTSEEEGLWIL